MIASPGEYRGVLNLYNLTSVCIVKTRKIIVENTEIAVVIKAGADDFICLTDMARYKDNDPASIIGHWMRLRNP